jgi:hypothetical protein
VEETKKMANAEAAKLMQKAKELMEKAKRMEAAEAEAVGRLVLKLRDRNFEGINDLDQLKSEVEKVLA